MPRAPYPRATEPSDAGEWFLYDHITDRVGWLTSVAAFGRRDVPAQPPAQVVATFASGHGWVADGTGTATLNDTSDGVLAAQHASIVTNGAGATARFTKTGLDLDLTDKLVRVWIKCDDATRLAGVVFFMGDATWANYQTINVWSQPNVSPPGPIRSGVWQAFTFDPSETATVTGTPPLDAITNLRFAITDTNAGQSATFRVGGVALVPRSTAFPNGVVSFTFDDGHAAQYTMARPKLDQYGYRATCFPIQDAIDNGRPGFLSHAQLRALHDLSGWEVAAHATTEAGHNASGGLTTLSTEQLDAEFAQMRWWLADKGYGSTDLIAYPQGLINQTVLDRARAHFAAGRLARHHAPDETLPPTPGEGLYKLRITALDSSLTLSNLQAAVDGAYANKTWLILMGHNLSASATTGSYVLQATFDSLVDYVNTKGIAVRPMGDVLRSLA